MVARRARLKKRIELEADEPEKPTLRLLRRIDATIEASEKRLAERIGHLRRSVMKYPSAIGHGVP